MWHLISMTYASRVVINRITWICFMTKWSVRLHWHQLSFTAAALWVSQQLQAVLSISWTAMPAQLGVRCIFMLRHDGLNSLFACWCLLFQAASVIDGPKNPAWHVCKESKYLAANCQPPVAYADRLPWANIKAIADSSRLKQFSYHDLACWSMLPWTRHSKWSYERLPHATWYSLGAATHDVALACLLNQVRIKKHPGAKVSMFGRCIMDRHTILLWSCIQDLVSNSNHNAECDTANDRWSCFMLCQVHAMQTARQHAWYWMVYSMGRLLVNTCKLLYMFPANSSSLDLAVKAAMMHHSAWGHKVNGREYGNGGHEEHGVPQLYQIVYIVYY